MARTVVYTVEINFGNGRFIHHQYEEPSEAVSTYKDVCECFDDVIVKLFVEHSSSDYGYATKELAHFPK